MSLRLRVFIMDIRHSTTSMPSSSTPPISIGRKPLLKTGHLNSDQAITFINVGVSLPGKIISMHFNDEKDLQHGCGSSGRVFFIQPYYLEERKWDRWGRTGEAKGVLVWSGISLYDYIAVSHRQVGVLDVVFLPHYYGR